MTTIEKAIKGKQLTKTEALHIKQTKERLNKKLKRGKISLDEMRTLREYNRY